MLAQIINTYDFKYPNFKHQMFDFFRDIFTGIVNLKTETDHRIIDVILLFFSELNSVFIFKIFGEFFSLIWKSDQSNGLKAQLLSMKGLKVC